MVSTSTFLGTLTPVAETASRRYHHGNLRAALLERAEQVVTERGVHALSLRELAREVGVSHGAPRRHFAGRQALLDALALEGFERLGRELRAALDGAGDAFDARLAAVAIAYFRFATRHAALVELMFAAKHRPGADELEAAAQRAFTMVLALIEEAQAAGELVSGDCERIGTTIFATLQGLTAMANGGMLGVEKLEAAVTDTVEQLLHGLRPR